MLRPRRRRREEADCEPPEDSLTDDERRILEINARAMLAGLVGWTICSLFASVAFNWTFYYVLALAVAGREIAAAGRPAMRREPIVGRTPGLARAHA
jgi:hypothetical protein